MKRSNSEKVTWCLQEIFYHAISQQIWSGENLISTEYINKGNDEKVKLGVSCGNKKGFCLFRLNLMVCNFLCSKSSTNLRKETFREKKDAFWVERMLLAVFDKAVDTAFFQFSMLLSVSVWVNIQKDLKLCSKKFFCWKNKMRCFKDVLGVVEKRRL